MYGLLLPNVTVYPKGSCNEVMRAVKGLCGVEDLHWVNALGLVDRDDRSDDEVRQMQGHGVFALGVHSAEAIYYSLPARHRLAERQAETHGLNPDELLANASEIAIAELSDDETMRRMCARRCQRLVAERVLPNIPNWQTIQDGEDIAINVPVKEIFEGEIDSYRRMLNDSDFDGLISRYPVRETGILGKIARALEFTGRSNYERAVLALASANDEFKLELRELLGPLGAELN